jgi:hypothetical protein
VIHKGEQVYCAATQAALDVIEILDGIKLHTQMDAMANEVFHALLHAHEGDKLDEPHDVLKTSDGFVVKHEHLIDRKRVKYCGYPVGGKRAIGFVEGGAEIKHDTGAWRRNAFNIV